MKKIGKPLSVALVLLLLWQLASASGIWSAYVFPSPQKVFVSFLKMCQSGAVLHHIGISLSRVLTGFSIAFVLAFLLGILAGVAPKGAEYYDPFLELMRHIPPIALIPLLILWFGIGETSKIIVIVLASFFPMFLNIKQGIASCSKKLLEVGDCFGFSKTRKFLRIILPSAVPDILVGMRIGLGYSWRAIIGAEMIAASSGLGYLILDAQQMSRSDQVIVGILIIGVVGILCDRLFAVLIRHVVHGGTYESVS